MRLALAVALGAEVFVVVVEDLRLDEGVKGLLNARERPLRAEGPNAEGHVQVDVHARTLRIALETLDVVLDAALVQLVDEIPLLRALEHLLQRVEHDTTQLLHIVLLEGVLAIPAERLGQIVRLDRPLLRRLQVEEQPLQLQRYVLLLVLFVRFDRWVVSIQKRIQLTNTLPIVYILSILEYQLKKSG